ncbi:hypothetical protein PLESTM_000943300 [Pleodorina starrii]|nr:hypothetical protein PLESTM_000943300 [Pleodorina starrii]
MTRQARPAQQPPPAQTNTYNQRYVSGLRTGAGKGGNGVPTKVHGAYGPQLPARPEPFNDATQRYANTYLNPYHRKEDAEESMTDGEDSEYGEYHLARDAAELCASDEELELSDEEQDAPKRRQGLRGRPSKPHGKGKKAKVEPQSDTEHVAANDGPLPTYKSSAKRFKRDFILIAAEEAANSLGRPNVMASKADKLAPAIPRILQRWQQVAGGPLYTIQDFPPSALINLLDNNLKKVKKQMADIRKQHGVTGARVTEDMVAAYEKGKGADACILSHWLKAFEGHPTYSGYEVMEASHFGRRADEPDDPAPDPQASGQPSGQPSGSQPNQPATISKAAKPLASVGRKSGNSDLADVMRTMVENQAEAEARRVESMQSIASMQMSFQQQMMMLQQQQQQQQLAAMKMDMMKMVMSVAVQLQVRAPSQIPQPSPSLGVPLVETPTTVPLVPAPFMPPAMDLVQLQAQAPSQIPQPSPSLGVPLVETPTVPQ